MTTQDQSVQPDERIDADEQVATADSAPPDAAAPRWWTPARVRVLRWVAIAAWAGGIAYQTVAVGVQSDPPLVVAWMLAAAVAFSIGRRRLRTVLIDFVPLAAVVVAWVFLRGAASTFGMPTWWTPQLDIDRALFGGVQPTVWLQEHLVYATPQWWNVPITLCYLSFFVLPYVTALVLWLRNRRDFRRWTLRWVALSFLGFACFALAPTAPPWAAARCTAAQVADHPSNPVCMSRGVSGGPHLMGQLQDPNPGVAPHVVRNSAAGLEEMHLDRASRLIADGAAQGDLVAAVPSLHAAATMLFGIFMWRRVRRRWRALLVAYPLFMGFTLVVSGEHYVVDILVGWMCAGLVSIVASAIERRRRVGALVSAPGAQSEAPEVGTPGCDKQETEPGKERQSGVEA